MLEDKPIGAALSRNLGSATAPGELVEAELDRLITRRHDQRVLEEGEWAVEAAWREGERREETRRREENRSGWLAWYRRLERVHLERAAACSKRAEALEEIETTERKSA